MALNDFVLIESCLTKVIIYIASEYKVVAIHMFLANLQHTTKTTVRLCRSIDIIAMSVEEPKLMGIFLEKTGICRILK